MVTPKEKILAAWRQGLRLSQPQFTELLWRKSLPNGTLLKDAVAALIAAIPNEAEKAIFEAWVRTSPYVYRLDQKVVQACTALGVSDETADSWFKEAVNYGKA